MSKINEAIKNLFRRLGYEIIKLPKDIYNEDSLITQHNHDFMYDPYYLSAYNRGVKACEEDYKIHWRTHVALWAASHGKLLDGDFVECGVNRGFFSSAIMQYCDWNSLGKHFFLFDTFCGLDEKDIKKNEKEKDKIKLGTNKYPECYEKTKANFSEFKNVHLIRGSIPGTLRSVDIAKVCYLSVDMNCAEPEIAAANYFWEKMVSGAVAILDDYAYLGFGDQKRVFDKFAADKGIKILSLPTGQGLYIKP